MLGDKQIIRKSYTAKIILLLVRGSVNEIILSFSSCILKLLARKSASLQRIPAISCFCNNIFWYSSPTRALPPVNLRNGSSTSESHS